MSERIPVAKTYKLYVGGAFIRSESGRTFTEKDAAGDLVGNICQASRKDLREALKKARGAQPGWAERTPFNRSQILFRVAEVLETRRGIFEELLVKVCGWSAVEAKADLDAAVDRTFWYAGWCDKFSQALGGINPVGAPYFNFTLPDPQGVVCILSSRTSPILGLLSGILPAIVPGNTCVVVADNRAASITLELGEVLATSDVPGGVVNLLTGERAELLEHAAGHMDINAIAVFGGEAKDLASIQEGAAENIKRVSDFDDPDPPAWRDRAQQSPYWIEKFCEWKTAWHPVGV